METDLTKFGARAVLPQGIMAVRDADPENVTWNFGVAPKTDEVETVIQSKGTLHSRFPALAGKWDGKSTINHWDAARKVLGDKYEDLIQYQPRGTCGGRAGSFTMDMVQLIQIANGKRAKFHRVSHAAVYYMARKLYNMLHGNWRDDNNDGVASGAVPEALSKLGIVQREADTDAAWYGPGSDDLACQLGCGMNPELAAKILELGKDFIITEWSPVKSAQELADGIAAGGMGIGSDMQGFTMTRDSYGFCDPRGTWSHYQTRGSVGVYKGRKGFGYCQSWGKTTPAGPQLEGHPGNCFGVDFDVQDSIVRKSDWAVVFGVPLWDLEAGNTDVPWAF